MIPKDLVQIIKKSRPEVLKNIPEARAAAVIKEVWLEIGHHLDALNEGVVKIPKLGKFIIRQVEQNMGDQKVMVKKISFIPVDD